MCLDPGTDRLFRITRSARELPARGRSLTAGRPPRREALPAPARRALDILAGDDDLVARGWVVLSRQAHA